MADIYIFDPTTNDLLSKVRGVGRYVQVLREQFEGEFQFANSLEEIPDHSIFINPFFDLLKQPLTIKRIARRQVAVIHDIIPLKYPEHYPPGVKGRLHIRLNRMALKKYDMIITDTEHVKKDIIELLKFDEKKIRVVYPVVSNNAEKKATKPKIALPSSFLLYVGDVTWNKNITNLAKAIQIAQIPCVFVGKSFSTFLEKNIEEITHPEQQEVKNFLQVAKGSKYFIFPGFISDEELNYLYKNAVGNILVSHDEGFGYSYVEAALFGTPSILSHQEVFKETAQDTALFADENDPEDIAQHIKELFKNQKLRAMLGEKAKERSVFFSKENFKKEFKEAIEKNKYYEI